MVVCILAAMVTYWCKSVLYLALCIVHYDFYHILAIKFVLIISSLLASE